MIEFFLSPEIGHFSLALACCFAGAQCIFPFIGANNGNPRLMALATPLALGQVIVISLAFLCLIIAAISNDFSVQNIFYNSATDTPLFYKITGVWGNHEGSILLWNWVLATLSAIFSLFSYNLPSRLRAKTIAILGGCAAIFELFCLTTSNPFTRIWPAPLEGNGLNPLLQDPGLAFHPPLLYIGYVGFSIPFALAIAALIEGYADGLWGLWIRQWAALAWIFLTAGIVLGSWWSYYVLGWGGYWSWDPVENAALLPWLTGTALFHSARIVEKRESLKPWTILLAIGTFSLSLSGTFLMRSGILSSVHSFASDPSRGLFLLLFLLVISGGALLLFACRISFFIQDNSFSLFSREGALVINNVLLCSMAVIIFTGTVYPSFLQLLTGQIISVGRPFFDITLPPLALIAGVVMVFGPLIPFRKSSLSQILPSLCWSFIFSCTIGLIFLFYTHQYLSTLVIIVSLWIIIEAFFDFGLRLQFLQFSFQNILHRFVTLPYSFFATYIAHIGMAITLLGIVGMTFSQQKIVEIPTGETVFFAGYNWRLLSVQNFQASNYETVKATIQISKKGRIIAQLTPSRRFFPRQSQIISNVAIHTNLIRDFYSVLGETQGSIQKPLYILRLHYNPLAPWIWLGGSIMIIGGILTLFDRKPRMNQISQEHLAFPKKVSK